MWRPAQSPASETLALQKPSLASFPLFLSLVEEHGPARLAQVAHDLRDSDPDSWTDLFTQYWTHIDAPTDPQEFLVLAFFQPYAEFARSRASLRLEGYTSLAMPFLQSQTRARRPPPARRRRPRSLLCGFCSRNGSSAASSARDAAKKTTPSSRSIPPPKLPYIRVECCDTCRTYIKSIDLAKNGLADRWSTNSPLSRWTSGHKSMGTPNSVLICLECDLIPNCDLLPECPALIS